MSKDLLDAASKGMAIDNGCAGFLIYMIELYGLRRWESPCTRNFERVEAMAPPPCLIL